LRTIVVFVTALLVGLGSLLVGTATSANAQPGTITDVKFQNETFKDGSRQRIDVNWAVTGTAQAPVTVSIDLPAELKGYTDRFDMMDGATKAGECVVTATAIECAVDDAYVADHPQNMKGSFFFYVDVRLENTEEETKTFDFGDASSTVIVKPKDAPGPGTGPCEEDCDYKGTKGSKGGSITSLENGEITWTVVVAAPPEGIAAGQEISVTDHLDTDVYEYVSGPTVREARSFMINSAGKWNPYYVGKTEGVTVSPDKLTASFTSVAGGLTPEQAAQPDKYKAAQGSFYSVQWKVKVKNGIKNNVPYENTADWTIAGVKSEIVKSTVKRQGGGADVVGENEGQFTLKKELSGDANLNPEFTVKYTLDGKAQPDIKISADGTFTSGILKSGSKITLEEVKPTGPDNVTWKDPVFVVDGKETDKVDLEFSKANGNLGKITEIRLKNEANLKTGSIPASKHIVNEDDVVLPKDLKFTLDYTWNADEAKGISAGSGSVTLPGDGAEVNIDDLPIGAEVHFTEKAPADLPGGTWEAPQISPSKVIVGQDQGVKVKVTNTLSATVGDFSVEKLITGDAADMVPDDATFTVKYAYPAGDGFTAGAGELVVPADGTAKKSVSLPVGAEVTLTEVAPGEVAGATWGTPQFSPKSFTVKDGETVKVKLTNTISRDVGSFSVQKLIDGDAADMVPSDATFTVKYAYPAGDGFDAGQGELEVKADGDVVSPDEQLPAGAEVTLTEATPDPVAGATWGAPEFSPKTFTIGKDQVVKVELTNTISKDLGSFSVQKLIDGDGASLVPDDASFTVKYQYEAGPGFDADEGELTVQADGKAVESGALPAGAEVTLTEVEPGEVAGATWGDPKFSTDTVTIGKDETVEVELTNTINKIPPKKVDKPDDSKKVSKDKPAGILPGTGADVSPLAIALAFALLIAGGATIGMLRRRS